MTADQLSAPAAQERPGAGQPEVSRMPRETLTERFWAKVAKAGPYECWEWTGSTHPYGSISVDGKTAYAHRVAYELAVGPIPEGLHIDHLCRNKGCVNPAHLEVVSPGENVLRGIGPTARAARKTHCVHGHPFSGENLYITREGTRGCRACKRERARMTRRRNRLKRVRAWADRLSPQTAEEAPDAGS